ncbi:MAG: PA14 domain-containing protein [Caldilineaceae bacterium]
MLELRSKTRSEPYFRSFSVGLLALALAFWGQRELYQHNLTTAALAYGLAILVFAYLFRNHLRTPLVIAPRLYSVAGWSLFGRMLPGILAIGMSAWALRRFQSDLEHPALSTWWLYIGSVLCFILMAVLLDWRAKGEKLAEELTGELTEAHARSELWQGWQIGALIMLFGLALFFRLWRFDELPFGTWYDEAENGLQALRILNSDHFYPLFVGSIHAPAHYLYLITFVFRYWEVSTQAIRLVSVLMGVATVAAALLAGRELFNRNWALVLALFVAVARWNVNFSRIGMYNASTPLFELLAVGFLLRGIRRGRYTDFALTGLWLGLGLCFYAAFQLFIGAILLFLLIASLFLRNFLRRTWPGLIVMLVSATLVIAPVALYAYSKPEVYFERTKDTSIFADKTPIGELAPWVVAVCARTPVSWQDRCHRLPLLWENARKHLLMFNYRGDPNGRHNLPGEPMLDNLMAMLMVLGLALALTRFWRPRALLLILWLGITLLGGVLSLGFEAPQSLRAIGTQPAAYVLAVVPLYALWQAWSKSGGYRLPQFYVAPLCVLLLWISYDNFHTYFYRQAEDFASWNAFSTPETITADLLNKLDDQTEAYVISYFHGHPTLNFLARTAQPYKRVETTDHLPLQWQEGKNAALIVNADSRSLFEEARHYYPAATFQEFTPPAGGPTVIYYAYLTQQDIQSVQGLHARYYANADWEGAPVWESKDLTLQFDWAAQTPVPLPFSVEWDGVLDVRNYGSHQFFLQAPAYAELYVGEQKVLVGEGAMSDGLVLAEGKHNLRVRAVGSAGPFSLSWRPPDRGPEIIPAAALYVPPITSNGLLGKYYANNQWQGLPALERIDTQLNLYFHITPLPRPYTVEWSGKIAIPQNGNYRFGLESIDQATLWINGQEVTASLNPNEYREGAITLESGLQDIQVQYSDSTDHTHINLYWTPPFGGQQLVPAEVLFPPQANYERVTLPDLTQLTFDPNAPAAPIVSGVTLGGTPRAVAGGFNQPKGVAVGPDNRLYVADTGNQRVLVLQPDGTLVGQLQPTDPFVEPFDIAVDQEGVVYVLDAGADRVARFDRADNYLGDLPVDSTLVGRSRGIHVDQQGRIWVANTPGGRVVALDQEGKLLLAIPIWPGEDSQPVDVAVGNDGSIFVTDAGLNKLVRFDPSGRRLLAWDIPVANSVDSSHLTVAANGSLYMTKPEPFMVSQLTSGGDLIGDWSVIQPGGAIVKPIGITVDSSNRVWFVDTAGGALYVIEPDVG